MRLAVGLLVCSTLLRAFSEAWAEEGVRVPDAFVKAQDYLKLDANSRVAYVMGLMDGIFSSPLFGASQVRVLTVQSCLKNRNNIQMAEVLRQYIKEHPEDWHLGAHVMFYQRLIKLCPEAAPQ